MVCLYIDRKHLKVLVDALVGKVGSGSQVTGNDFSGIGTQRCAKDWISSDFLASQQVATEPCDLCKQGSRVF